MDSFDSLGLTVNKARVCISHEECDAIYILNSHHCRFYQTQLKETHTQNTYNIRSRTSLKIKNIIKQIHVITLVCR